MKGCLKIVGGVVVGGIVLFVLIAIGSMFMQSGERVADNATTASGEVKEMAAGTSAPVDTPTPAPAVGQDVFVGEVRWKILSAENLGDTLTDNNQFTEDVKTSGVFVKVRFEIENQSKDMKSFAGLDLKDSQEREFKGASHVFSFIEQNETCILENLNPNIVKTCTSIYEVPAGAAGLRAWVGDLSFFGGAEEMIDLGL